MKIRPNVIPFSKQSLAIKWEVINFLKAELKACGHYFPMYADTVYNTKEFGKVRSCRFYLLKEKNISECGYKNTWLEYTEEDTIRLRKLVNEMYIGSKWHVELNSEANVFRKTAGYLHIKIKKNKL